MKAEVYCDECKQEFVIEELKIEESTLKKGGKVEKVIVQYFRCPKCGYKYLVSVYNSRIHDLNVKYSDLLKHHEGMSPQKFKLKTETMKRQMVAEESMLLHLYQKQHKEKVKSLD